MAVEMIIEAVGTAIIEESVLCVEVLVMSLDQKRTESHYEHTNRLYYYYYYPIGSLQQNSRN